MNNKTITIALSLIGLLTATLVIILVVSQHPFSRLAIGFLIAWFLLSLCLMLAYHIYGAKNEN